MEIHMKKILPVLLAASLFTASLVMAQENAQEGSVSLDTFEKCNNWARHYCQNDNQAAAVNAELLRLKQSGLAITLDRIKAVAMRVGPNVPPPAAK